MALQWLEVTLVIMVDAQYKVESIYNTREILTFNATIIYVTITNNNAVFLYMIHNTENFRSCRYDYLTDSRFCGRSMMIGANIEILRFCRIKVIFSLLTTSVMHAMQANGIRSVNSQNK